MNIRTAISRAVSATPLAYLPVRVRSGLAKGARWTFLPFSWNWRFGGQERDVEMAASYLPRLTGAVFWDFGAHFGIHTVGMALQVGPSGQVAAFEPDPIAFARLSYHVSINKLSNVKLFRLAASSGTGASFLEFDSRGRCTSRVGDAGTAIETVAVDEVVASGELRQPDLIKIDVEGHGPRAVTGCLQTIRQALPLIVYSNHSDQERSGMAALLKPIGYEVRNLFWELEAWGSFHDVVLLVPPRYSAPPCR
jgi:FkbM family methyltransferase